MSGEERELTGSEEWFRDKLNEFLGLGGVAVMVIAGWLISNDSAISLAHEAGADKRQAALFLSVGVPAAWALWYAALAKIHSRCPRHPTVLGRRSLHLYAFGVGLALFAVVYLAVDGAL